MATESSVGTITQARVFFTVPPAVSTPPPATIIVGTEDMASILQDTLQRMENMFASAIYQNTDGEAPTAYAPPEQYATLPQQHVTPPQQYATLPRQYAAPPLQQYSAPPPQSYTASTIPSSAGP
jgi:hypothetical protein